MEGFITYSELRDAYLDCRRHKRNAPDAVVFARDYESRLCDLRDRLNSGEYRISPAKRFAVSVPKLREVYAYAFGDRVVEHLIANRILPILEDGFFIPDVFSCRKGKGVLYGVNRMAEQIRGIGRDCWYASLDIKGYFPSMRREVIRGIIEPVIRRGWRWDDDIEPWLSLLRMFIFHDPSRDCIECGNREALAAVPPEKCLGSDRGEPIGNLLNQLFAIVYLTPIDRWLRSELEGYGRYVDDMLLLSPDRRKLHRIIPQLRGRLAEIGLELNERKTVIQRADKGVKFTGYVIKPWGVYPGNRLRRNAVRMSGTKEDAERHLRRVNSYLGLLRHALTYGLRFRIWERTKSLYRGIWAKTHIHSIHKLKTI